MLVAGCGGSPSRSVRDDLLRPAALQKERLPVLTAMRLERAAARHDCRRLLRGAIVALNRHEVPSTLQEPLLSEANRCRFPRPFRP
jgi:hypothetical protein